MVTANFKYKKKKMILELKGHADTDEHGKDLVCAASSMLAFTVAQVLIDMWNAGKLMKKPNIKMEEGNASLVCKPKDEFFAEALHTYHVAQTGYNVLQHNYPGAVQLITFGRDYI